MAAAGAGPRGGADRIQAFAGVDNLLDAGDATTNPIPPRSFYGGVTVRY